MSKITSEIRASQWSVKAEKLIKNSTLAELKDFILNNGEVEEDPDEESFVHVGKKNLFGKTYLITAEGFHHDEFFITNEGRIFYLISLNHQVEIIDEEAPEGMKLEKAMAKRHNMENRLYDLKDWLNKAMNDDSVTDEEYDAVQKEVRELQTELHDFSVDILAGKFDEDYHQQVETPVDDPAEEIPEAVMNEIDYMLGSTEECNSEPLVSILKDHGIDPDGGWLFIESVPDEVIQDINEKLFETGLIVPFVWEEGEMV